MAFELAHFSAWNVLTQLYVWLASYSTHSSEKLPSMVILKKLPRTSLSNFHVLFSSYQLILLFYYLFIVLLSLPLQCTNLVFLAHCSPPYTCHSAWHIADTQYLTGEGKDDSKLNVRCHLMWGPLLCSSVSDHKLAASCRP